MKIDYGSLNNANINLSGKESNHNGSIRGQYGHQIHYKNKAAEMLPHLKYKYNRSFLGDGFLPHEDSGWDKAGMANARNDYQKIQAARLQEVDFQNKMK